MRKILLIAILLIGSLASAGALDLQEFAQSVGGRRIVALVLPIGQKGEICFRGPQIMKGYWKKPEATEEAFRGGRFHTGDIGFLDQDGFVTLVDRKKDMILSGGFNVFPRNIEEVIYEHPAVAEVTVIGIPDAYQGQSAKAFIALKPGHSPFGIDELRAFLADKLAKYEMPTEMEIRASLGPTSLGLPAP